MIYWQKQSGAAQYYLDNPFSFHIGKLAECWLRNRDFDPPAKFHY